MKKLFYFLTIFALVWACKEDEPEVSTLKINYEVTHVTLKGGSDGAIDLTISGGETPYIFEWSNGASTEDISNLDAGNYTVKVTDKSNQSVSETITINNSDVEVLKLSYTKIDVSEENGNDGSIDLTINGGLEPYTILWSNGETTEDLRNLTAGTYSVEVTDSLNQQAYDTIIISQPSSQNEMVSMGASYNKDVYYSLANGTASSPDRTEWDLAFYTNPMTSTIITNDGMGIKLYVWPNGTKDDWATAIDTNGMLWPSALYNTYSDTSWQNGAFDKNSLGHPDYGWGQYDMTSHGVFGDSIHIIDLGDGTLKKLLIEQRNPMTNTFHIKYADLDGTNEQTSEIVAADHLDKNLIHFSLKTNQTIIHEPASESWDLMFTKYFDESIPYIVSGILTNNGIMVAKGDTTTTDYMSLSYSKVINTIGSDWKSFNMGTYQYDLSDNLVFFIKDLNGDYYSIKFTAFEGSSSGNIEFIKKKL